MFLQTNVNWPANLKQSNVPFNVSFFFACLRKCWVWQSQQPQDNKDARRLLRMLQPHAGREERWHITSVYIQADGNINSLGDPAAVCSSFLTPVCFHTQVSAACAQSGYEFDWLAWRAPKRPVACPSGETTPPLHRCSSVCCCRSSGGKIHTRRRIMFKWTCLFKWYC